MTLVLNLTSGILHASERCAGADRRLVRQYRFTLEPWEELVGFLDLPFRRVCRKCVQSHA